MTFALTDAERRTFDNAVAAWKATRKLSNEIAGNLLSRLSEQVAASPLGSFMRTISSEASRSLSLAWHGIGIDTRASSKKLLLFSAFSDAIDGLKTLASNFGSALPVDVLQIPRFRFCASPGQPAPAINPGKGVFAVDGMCQPHDSSHGSVGAFLKFTDATAADPNFLLSACHVLGRKCQRAPEVHLDSGPLVSKLVHSVNLLTSGSNLVDAAVAELRGVDLQNVFPGITVTSDVPAPQPLEPCTAVEKLGAGTGATKGRVVTLCSNIEVLPDTGTGTVEFDNQLMIVSQDDRPFVLEGDSGSLLVSNGAPAGIIIAKSERAAVPGQPAAAPGGADGRYALASPFDVVLQQVQAVLGNRPLKMIL